MFFDLNRIFKKLYGAKSEGKNHSTTFFGGTWSARYDMFLGNLDSDEALYSKVPHPQQPDDFVHVNNRPTVLSSTKLWYSV